MTIKAKFVLEIDLNTKYMHDEKHVAKALRDLSDQFYYSCEHFPHGSIMDTNTNDSHPVGHYGVVITQK